MTDKGSGGEAVSCQITFSSDCNFSIWRVETAILYTLSQERSGDFFPRTTRILQFSSEMQQT
jgi:hypothetical protein